MPTRELPEFFDEGALKYPGITSTAHPAGKTYRVPPPDADTGLRWASLGEAVLTGKLTDAERDRLRLDDNEERSFFRQVFGCTPDCEKPQEDGTRGPVCGSVLDEMRADGVPYPRIKLIAADVFMYWSVNEQFADAVLTLESTRGEAAARANRATRRAAAKKTASPARTPRRKAGSGSATASTATPGRTRGRTSTQSSKSTPPAEPTAAAG